MAEAIEPSEGEAAASRHTRKPSRALLGNLFFPPLGHVYIGEARRGFVLLIIAGAFVFAGGWLFLLNPSLTSFLMMLVLGIAPWLAMCADAFMRARKQAREFVPRRYNSAPAYIGVAVFSMLFSALGRAAVETFFMRAFRSASESMRPTVLHGDYFMVNKSAYWSANVLVGVTHPGMLLRMLADSGVALASPDAAVRLLASVLPKDAANWGQLPSLLREIEVAGADTERAEFGRLRDAAVQSGA